MEEKKAISVRDDLYNRIGLCLDELADAKGIEKCTLVYGMGKLLEAYRAAVENDIAEAAKAKAKTEPSEDKPS